MTDNNGKVRPFGIKDKLGYMFGDFGNDFTFLLSAMFLLKLSVTNEVMSLSSCSERRMDSSFSCLLTATISLPFMRRRSFRKPIWPSSLERTSEMRITSLSCPWKPSTVFTLIRQQMRQSEQ